jgi:UDP:flavonoid glycosyltransferase YjiC (YdhE family)
MELLFATLGSLGDVRPIAALAAAAQRAGHSVVLATSPSFEHVAAAAEVPFSVFGEDAYFEREEVRRGMVRPEDGFGFWMGWSNLRAIEALYARLDWLAENAELLVATPFVMAAHLVALRRGIPLVNCCLSPASLISNAGKVQTFDPHAQEWRTRLNTLRRQIGLPTRTFPQMERFSAALTLGLYPKFLGGAREGSYVRTPLEIGYPTLPPAVGARLSSDLQAWLSLGPYVLVTFGSYVDRDAQACLRAVAFACETLDLRCLYLSPHAARLFESPSERIRLESFAPHDQVMSGASIIVHHCGTGTLAAAIEAGKPMLATPFGLDQTFNAERLAEQNLAEVLPADQITGPSLRDALSRASSNAAAREAVWRNIDHGVGPEVADLAFGRMWEALATNVGFRTARSDAHISEV